MKAILLLVFYLCVVLLPLVLSWVMGGPPRSIRYEIASGLGILAFSMILIEFVSSGRFKGVSNTIGMDNTMRFHQIMARTALVFAMIHPFFYGGSPSGGPRPWDVTRQLTLTTDLSELVTGIAAFLLIPLLVLSAISRRNLDMKYETWRLAHGLGALVIAGLLLHHTTHAGRYAEVPEIAGLWKVMTAIAIFSLLYVYFIEPLREGAHRWQVASVTQLSPKQWQLTVSPTNHAGMDYKAGQFAWLKVGRSAFSLNENPFSISSAPASGSQVSFVIKELGDFTSTLGQIKPGTRAYLDGPYGSLSVDGRSEPGIALIAGGVGIAPMLGILRQMRLTNDPRKIKLVYGNRVQEQIVFPDELATVDMTCVLSDPPEDWQGETGMIDGALLDRVFTDQQFQEWLFVLCGPTAMMDGVQAHLISKSTPVDRILSERFDYD